MLLVEKLENLFDLRVDITSHLAPPRDIIVQHYSGQRSDHRHAALIQFS